MSTQGLHSNYFNRELSWIEFNRRVLEEARDSYHPPLERAKFLAIFATNLDEFYMIRVSGLREQVMAGVELCGPDGLSPAETLKIIHQRVSALTAEHAEVWTREVRPLLAQHNVRVLDWEELNREQRQLATDYFNNTVYPVLTPLAVDSARPFPHISNLSLNLAVLIRDDTGRDRFARVKVPPNFPRLLPLSPCTDEAAREFCFVWLEQVIAAHINLLFPGMRVTGVYPFRVTRDADIEIQEDEASDLRQLVQRSLRERRFGQVVRLEIASTMPPEVRQVLIKGLNITEDDVCVAPGVFDLSCLWQLHRLPLPELKDPPLHPALPRDLDEREDLFDRIRRGDVLLHHPYESFEPVVEFVRAAARDPNVLAIKQTLYRVGSNSPIVEALMEAVQSGKQVAVLVELKARFDEENNLQWTKALEQVGVHVVYGLARYKVHAKVCLVVRRDPDGVIRRYVHLGTGNYNASTARVYTDLGILTSREEIGQDATELFNFLTGYSKQRRYSALIVAPVNLRQRLAGLIEREINHQVTHGNGRLIFKVNALVDTQMIDLLYRASQVGVKIDLLVRGMCCLRPGVPGLSENIRVVSIVGRFLEHSRVYYFHNNGREEMYLGSADLMERNLDRRVETLFPILDPAMRNRIKREVLELGLKDNVKARELKPDGCYARVVPAPDQPRIDSQMRLLALSGLRQE
ncbi:MAG: polyphosphate kinase 1 [Anaerolineae bacterium]|nr:polyphosphate kinase 1 [Thermoflexales bacterium]MDW8394797.1 polyphosphate kinase 1 [Anaerolineae bacterium]